MAWRKTLFFKLFLWFWLSFLLAIVVGVLTSNWLENDFFRESKAEETQQLITLISQERPIIAEGRKLWRKMNPGWNLVSVHQNLTSQLPHNLEDFVDHAAHTGQVMFGQDSGWLMIGPIAKDGYLYIAVSHSRWLGLFETHDRLLVLLSMMAVITCLCALFAWSLSAPLRRLQATVTRLGQADFDTTQIHAVQSREDEVGGLAREVVKMASSLQRLLHSHEQLLRDVSHELRSPLTRLQIALAIARKKDQNHLLDNEHDRIERGVNQINNLISQILDRAKLQQDDEHLLQRKPESLLNKLRIWIEDADMELKQKRLNVVWNTPPHDIICTWDWLLIERAFDNLVRNAMRHAPVASAITIGVAAKQKSVALWVEDQGQGVADTQLEEIFNPFTQADASRDHAQGGYGLGLALVKRIVELHSGIVQASNESTGFRMQMLIPVSQNQ